MFRATLKTDQEQLCFDWEENKTISGVSFRQYEDSWMRNRIIQKLELNGWTLEEIYSMNEDTMYRHYLEIKRSQI